MPVWKMFLLTMLFGAPLLVGCILIGGLAYPLMAGVGCSLVGNAVARIVADE